MEVRLEIANLDSGVKSPGRPNIALPCPELGEREAAVVFASSAPRSTGLLGSIRAPSTNLRLENRAHLGLNPSRNLRQDGNSGEMSIIQPSQLVAAIE